MSDSDAWFTRRCEDWRRHVTDLQDRTYEGAGPREAREQVFRWAFELTTPVALGVLAALDAAYLGGAGEAATVPPHPVRAEELEGADRSPAGGLLGWWSLTWSELERARNRLDGEPLPPVAIFAMFPAGFTHPHLALFDLGRPRRWVACWPLQVATAEDAARQERTLAAIAEADFHERTFAGDLNWRLLRLGAPTSMEVGRVD